MAKGTSFLNPALKDKVTYRNHDHRILMDQIDQGLLSHKTQIESQTALIATLQAQIEALQKKVK